MFDALAFSTPVQTQALTLEAVIKTTGLTWVQVDLDDPQIPTDQGVYVWVDEDAPHALRYHGSGSGKNGLRGRLVNQLRWRKFQRDRREFFQRVRSGLAALAGSEQRIYELASEVPAVQQAADGRQLYYAIAKPAPWSVERNEIAPPQGSLEWEAFISAVSLLVVGHRGLIGGGAWEYKAGTVGARMQNLTWDRLVDLNRGTWV